MSVLPDSSEMNEQDKNVKFDCKEKYIEYQDLGLKEPIIKDCQMIRTQIPGNTVVKVKVSNILKMLKDLIGKDLSKFSLPVFVNEPSSVLMKPAEQMFFNKCLTQASRASEKSSTYRMMLVTQALIQGTYTVPKRLGKPFNPLLGETYEIVTSKFRYFSESVSHHPPIFAINCQGAGYEMRRTMESVQ